MALDVLLSGRVFLADEAKQMGIVNRVFVTGVADRRDARLRPGPRRQRLTGIDGRDQDSRCTPIRCCRSTTPCPMPTG